MEIPVGRTDVPVAIIGMACRLPGADNLEQYWDLLINGRSAVVELPAERLNQELYYDPRKGQRNKTYSKLGAIISSRQFNRQACPIPKDLERGVDNAHLLMCEVAAAACRHAGLDPFHLPLRNTGVYVAHAQGSNLNGDYTFGTSIEEAAQFLREVPQFAELEPNVQEGVLRELIDVIRNECPQRRADSPNLATNMVAGTISKAFRLSGPYMAVNSACASSLQAILFAARALQLGRIDMAIVGGASDCKSDSLVLFSHAQSMSETGSRPFDSGADGLICSEGYVSLVLKTLPRALADGDHIQAVIRGIGMSSDGKGKSLWAPRKEGQIKAMERAYRNGVEMGSLQYIEAHATSTGLGDATELNALAEVLSDKLPPGRKIPVTSVKANIGHALEAAGLASVVKAVLCMQHRTFVPAINIRTLNNKIDWQNVPIYIPQQAAPWPEQPNGLPRRAGVNAFGIGGLNVHLLMEEYVASTAAANSAPSVTSRPQSSDEDSIAVVGMGCIFPGAPTPEEFWKLIAEGRDPKGPVPPGRWRPDLAYRPGVIEPYRSPTLLGGYITDFAYDWRKHKLPPKQLEQADPLQFMLLEAADQALIDAGYNTKEFDRTRTAAIVGTDFGSDFGAQLQAGLRLPYIEQLLKKSLARRNVDAARAHELTQQFATVLLKHWPALIDESGSFSTSTLASRITKTMNLMGGAVAIDSGDASSAAALATSIDMLLSGDCDTLFCAAGARRMGLAQYEGMAAVGVLAQSEQVAGPFDAEARGVVPGEGVGVLLLKRLSDARRDGDRIHAIIRGVGAAYDDSRAAALKVAIERAFDAARVDRGQVAVLEVDGTGAPQSDLEQLSAVQSAYGNAARSQPMLLGSITAQIGHTLGASGMASVIKASMEMHNAQMPPILGLKTPLPALTQSGNLVRPAASVETIRPLAPDGRCFAGVLSSDKGLAYHVVIERGAPLPVAAAQAAPVTAKTSAPASQSPASPISHSPVHATAWSILRLGASTQQELIAKLQAAVADPHSAFSNATASRFVPADLFRLAIVAESAEALSQKLQSAAKQVGNPAALPVLEQQGCFYRQLSGERPRIAFLFPGQGSQYAGMLQELVRDVPAATAMMREIDSVLARKGFKSFAEMAWHNPAQLGVDVWVTQIVVLLSDLIVHAALTDLGIRADLVAGHSFGEFAALAASGAWDLDAVVTATRARYDAIMAVPGSRGTLMASTAPAELIERFAATLTERVFAANYNAPDQTVVGGRPEALAELSRLLEAQNYKCQMLSVPCPFHTPLMAGSGSILKQTLDTLRISPPRVPFISTVTNRFVAEPDDIRENLASQLTTPVRWVDLLLRLSSERDTVFVEVGPQQALSRLNRRIVDERTAPGIIACDNPKRPGVEQLYRVKALLECVGALDASDVSRQHSASTSFVTKLDSGPAKGLVTHVDATLRRREKMRDTATKSSHAESLPSISPSSQNKSSNGVGSNGNGHTHERMLPISEPTATAASAPNPPPVPARDFSPAAPEPLASPAVAVKAGGPAPEQLETFLINFVVDQTGYPPEVVELDADLEADLGIDSIKKAQLFGELAEYFDVQATEGMTLDEFPTLRHVLNFLQGKPTKGTSEVPPAAMPVSSAPVTHASPVTATDTGTANGSAAHETAQTPAAASAVAVKAGGPAPEQLETFLINFVVEQTGYPPEVVELDADLEADLGIDSIKKAQLFGELAEYFDVQATEGMTLDEFPTLRHVLNFLQGKPTKGTGEVPPAAMPASSAPVTHASPVTATATVTATANGSAAHETAQTPAASPAVAVKAGGPAPEQLETFLINFVVEQTGYPPEVVELDADLEADLGIDSIKKAQLFGELAEYFDVQATEGMTLDEFPTLRHVLNFLQGSPMKGTGAAPSTTAAETAYANGSAATMARPSTVAPASAPSFAAYETFTHASSSTAVVEPARPMPASVQTSATSSAGTLALDELQTFLINFVVEQTGYPPEVVELDADLEADLGIDSIKKAQLFGELAEYFDVQATEGMTLDDFPTLRHVLNFLQGIALKKNLTPSPFDGSEPISSLSEGAPEPGGRAGELPNANAMPAVEVPRQGTVVCPVPVLQLSGTPYDIGVAHGRACRNIIRKLLRSYADEAGSTNGGLQFASLAAQDLSTNFSADELDELRGIADGAKVPLANLIVHNSSIWADLGSASWHCAIARSGNAEVQPLHAVAEQLPLSGFLRGCLKPAIQSRQPTRGLPHFLLSFAGGVGSPFGVNAAGLSVSVCRLSKPQGGSEAQSRRGFASIAALLLAEADSVDSAIELLKARSLRGAFAACITHPASDRACYVEWDGRTLSVRDRADIVSADNTARLGSATIVGNDSAMIAAETRQLLNACAGSRITREAVKAQCSGAAATGSSDRRLAAIYDSVDGCLWLNNAGLGDHPSRDFVRIPLSDLIPPYSVWHVSKVQPAPAYDLGEIAAPATHRFALKMVDAPLDSADPHIRPFHGAALIVGDNPSAAALAARLRSAGVTVEQLTISDDLDATIAEFERLWNIQPLPHLFLMTARDLERAEPTDESSWRRRWYRVALLPYFLTQRWTQLAGKAGLLNSATLAAGTALGGHFGFSDTVVAPECGALTGLIKSVVIELFYLRGHKGLRAVAIDAPDEESPESFAASVYDELTSKAIDFEVGYTAGRRQLPYAYPQPAPIQEKSEIRPGGTWVVTGGARGITALCALELGRRFGLRLHLIGASPLPTIDPAWRDLSEEQTAALKAKVMREAAKSGTNLDVAWNRVKRDIDIDASLRSYAAAGVAVTYHSCDVADADALSRVLDAIRQESGPIEGVLHGAGIEISSQFERKKPKAVTDTLGAKVDGAVNLMRLTWHDPVRHFIGFGSIAGRLGSNGQTDYGLASDTLCKLAGWYQSRRRGTRSVGFHWHPWADVGMAASPATMTVMKRAGGPQQMPKQEGVWHFLRELYVKNGESEVLITDWDYYARYYGTKDVPPSALTPPGSTGSAPEPSPPTSNSRPEHTSESKSNNTWPTPGERIASRREIKLVAAPLPSNVAPVQQLSGTAYVLGDNAAARALRERLAAAGAQVHTVPMTNLDQALAAVESLYAAHRPRYIFLMTGRDDAPVDLLTPEGWRVRRSTGLVVPYLATQVVFRLRMKARDTSPLTLVAATALGGDFGISSKFTNVDGGALAGMLKSLYIEQTRRTDTEMRVKVIDAPDDEPSAAIVEAIFRELAAAEPDVEVAWAGGKRSVVRSIERKVENLPRGTVQRGGSWIVTGGARGITAAVALELGQRYGLKMHLFGSSPPPRENVPWSDHTKAEFAEYKREVVRRALAEGRSPESEWEGIARDKEIRESLKSFTAAGVNVEYHSCNLADRERLRTILREIRKTDGPITGIIHGAGYGSPGRFGTRTAAKLERTLHGKLDGAINLLAETQSDPVRYFLGFGSISGRHGGNGLSDYAAANDMLAKLCAWNRQRNPACASACMHWQTWDEVGMGMYGDNSAVGAKGTLKMKFISPREGTDHLCRELEAGLPTAEVIISDGYFEQLFYPFVAGQESPQSASGSAGQPLNTGSIELSSLPLVESVKHLAEDGAIEAEIIFNPAADPFLFDHQLRGRPLLPAVVSLEAAAEAAVACGQGRAVVALRDVEMLDGLAFHTERNITAKVCAKPVDANAIQCELVADFCNRAGKLLKKDRPYQRATVELADRRLPLDIVMPEPPTKWLPFSYRHDSPMQHGPTLRGATGTALDPSGGWGQLVALPLADFGGMRTGRDWLVPSTLLDAAFYICGIHAWVFGQPVVSLPKSIERLSLGRMPRDHEKCLVQIVCRELQRQHAVYDFVIFGDDRSAILSLKGHRIVMLQQ